MNNAPNFYPHNNNVNTGVNNFLNTPQEHKNSLVVFILGLASLVCGLAAIAGVILGKGAYRDIRNSNGAIVEDSKLKVGYILSWVVLIINIIVLVLVILWILLALIWLPHQVSTDYAMINPFV